MKLAATVSLAALALAGCASASQPVAVAAVDPGPPPPAVNTACADGERYIRDPLACRFDAKRPTFDRASTFRLARTTR